MGERRREGWAVMQNDKRVRTVFLGIAANDAKGRVTGSNFFVMVRTRNYGVLQHYGAAT